MKGSLSALVGMQARSALMTRMLGTSGPLYGTRIQSLSGRKAKRIGPSVPGQGMSPRGRYDTFSHQTAPELYAALDSRQTLSVRTPEGPAVGKAALEDVSTAFGRARAANRAALDDAGDRIVAVNARAGERLGSAGTLIGGKRYDFASEDYTTGGAYVGDCDRNAFNRRMVERQIESILSKNGITIGDGESYTFTVDAYTKRIRVSGADEDQSRAIERALDQGTNGKELYDHIRMCGTQEKNEQITEAGQVLRYAHELVEQLTGVRLSDCARQGDDYVTGDGRSVRALLADHTRRDPTDGFTPQEEARLLWSCLDRTLSYDYQDPSQKMDLSIRYDRTGLHDIGQEHSYGQGDTDWIGERIAREEARTGKKIMTLFL